ncbi:tyrosine-type recombinase/integrase [Vibrio breoganii]|uniref:tyrosine-type recombinase/integrase n=1 Tax=Vibrio breoganii TaxID=553239 RepID=UPI000C859019|nr:tyrosine-type recombinase/integrase [Vibrio breoganii]PMK31587.1 hypothetical protein BCU03_06895 [Vibrio breoganii]
MARLNPRIDAKILDDSKSSTNGAKKTKTASMPPKTIEQANRILDALYDRSPTLSLCCQMSALTGLRYSDSAWLKYSDFYDKHGNFLEQVTVIQQKSYNMRLGRSGVELTKENRIAALRKSKVEIYTTQEIQKIVEETRYFSDGSEFLFANARSRTKDENGEVVSRPMHVVSADRHHTAVQDELKLNFNLGTHSWRKFFALQLVRNGTTIEKIRDLLGQSSLASTDRYLHSFTHELRGEVQKVSLLE